MFEWIGSAIEVLRLSVDAYSGLTGARKLQQTRRIAVSMHLFYLRLIDCVATGEKILQLLRRLIEEHVSREGANGEPRAFSQDEWDLEKQIEEQRVNLRKLLLATVSMREKIDLIDPELSILMRQFSAEKGIGLDALEGMLQDGRISFDGLTIEDVRSLSAIDPTRFQNSNEVSAKVEVESASDEEFWSFADSFWRWYSGAGNIIERIRNSSVPIKELYANTSSVSTEMTNPDALISLREHILNGGFAHSLSNAKLKLNGIRDFIKDNFSVSDLLVDLDDSKMVSDVRWR